MILNGDEAPKDLTTEIRQILDRGDDFQKLTEDKLHKAKAFLKATGGRQRVSYEKQMEDKRTGKQERDQNDRRRLKQIVLFNEAETRKATAAAGGLAPGWGRFYKFVIPMGSGVLTGVLGNAIYGGTILTMCFVVVGVLLAGLVWAFVIAPR